MRLQPSSPVKSWSRRGPSDKPWGMYEFTLNGPDDTLIRVGWPTRLR